MGSKAVAIIGARLSSTRLPGKQLLDLAGQPIIAHIVNRLRQVPQLSEIIVATTNEDVNKPLVEWAASHGVTAFDWSGDQNDVVGRVDAAFQASGADRFVYVCGDCPLIEPKTIEKLLDASQGIKQGGIALLEPATSGKPFIHEGFDVFNKPLWNRMVSVAHEPFEREHIGAVYFHLNKVEPEVVSRVDEDPVFAEIDHRLSVDTPMDYAFAQTVYEEWYRSHGADQIVDLKWVISKLRSDPQLVAINAHVHQKAVKEASLSVSVLCEAGPKVGMGHLSRACVVANSLQAHLGAAVRLYIKGSKIEFSDLVNLPHEWVASFDNVPAADCVVCDVKALDAEITDYLSAIAGKSYRVAIDQVPDAKLPVDLLWIPAVYLPGSLSPEQVPYEVRYGADCFLLRRVLPKQNVASSDAKKLIVLTGGSDPMGLAKTLPQDLISVLPESCEITWVQGPYALPPEIGDCDNFAIVLSPTALHQYVAEFDVALCVFGVTFFECLQAKTQVVAFDPIGAATPDEWQLLKDHAPDCIADNKQEAVDRVKDVLDGEITAELPTFAFELEEGPQNFATALATGVAALKEESDAAA